MLKSMPNSSANDEISYTNCQCFPHCLLLCSTSTARGATRVSKTQGTIFFSPSPLSFSLPSLPFIPPFSSPFFPVLPSPPSLPAKQPPQMKLVGLRSEVSSPSGSRWSPATNLFGFKRKPFVGLIYVLGQGTVQTAFD